MKTETIMKNIVTSSIYKKEIGTAFQLGLPRFIFRSNELFMKFYPHLEKYFDGIVSYYPPQYELELVYPFRHIVLFKNLAYTTDPYSFVDKDPVCKIHTRDLAVNVSDLYDLFSLADEIIQCREADIEYKNQHHLQSLVLNYDKHYILTAKSMRLQTIYGGAYDSHSCL